MPVNLVEGETAPIQLVIKDDGTVVDLTGKTVDSYIKNRDGRVVSTTGDLSGTSSTGGTITLNPDAVDFKAKDSPYAVRIKVTDGASKVRFYPNGEPDVWTVYRP